MGVTCSYSSRSFLCTLGLYDYVCSNPSPCWLAEWRIWRQMGYSWNVRAIIVSAIVFPPQVYNGIVEMVWCVMVTGSTEQCMQSTGRWDANSGFLFLDFVSQQIWFISKAARQDLNWKPVFEAKVQTPYWVILCHDDVMRSWLDVDVM